MFRLKINLSQKYEYFKINNAVLAPECPVFIFSFIIFNFKSLSGGKNSLFTCRNFIKLTLSIMVPFPDL